MSNALFWNEVTTLPQRLAVTDLLHAEVVMAVVAALQHNTRHADTAALVGLEIILAREPNPGLRRVALAALVANSQPPRGWDAARLTRLQHYRADPAPLVAAAAQFTFPPEES